MCFVERSTAIELLSCAFDNITTRNIIFSDGLIPTDIYRSVIAIYRRNYRRTPMINITDGLICR